MLSFLSPLFLVGALAAAIPVALHLLKRDPEPLVKFSAVALLRQAPVERTSTRRLRQIVLLLMRVAALVLLALAFARPFFPSAAAAASRRATVIALDTSFSLSAPGRFARAQQLARDALTVAPTTDDVGVVTFSDRAELVARPSADRALALAAIDGAVAGWGGTRYLAGVNMAARALGARPGSIVVITDLQESGWDAGDHASVPEAVHVEVRDVGALPDNFAVVSLRLDGDRVVATVRNDSARTRIASVRLTIDGRAAGERSIPAGPHGAADAVFGGVTGGEAVAAVDDREGLQPDNSRYALLKNSSRAAALAVTSTGELDRDAFYVHQALTAGGAGGSAEIAGVAGAQLGRWPIERLSAYTAVLLLSTRGLERRGRELLASYAAGGGGLLIAAGPDVDGDVAADIAGPGIRLRLVAPEERGTADSRSIAPADVRHPIFQPFGPGTASFGLVRFARAARLAASGCQTLAKFSSGDPAIVDCGLGDGRAIVMASDLNNRWNDFPLHATFVPFLHETVRYLSNAHEKAGEYLVGEVPPGVPAIPGIVTIPGNATTRARRVAINVDPAECEPARISADEFGSAIARLKESGVAEARNVEVSRESSQHVWQYVLGAMMLTLFVEGIVAARTV
jgi:VWA domain-containing protein/aerotolerance regulator-like protein